MRVACPPLRPAACVCMYECVAEHARRVSSSSTRSMCAMTPNQLRTLLSPQHVCSDEPQHVCRTRELLSPLATTASAFYNATHCVSICTCVAVKLVKCAVATCHERVSLWVLQLLQHVSLRVLQLSPLATSASTSAQRLRCQNLYFCTRILLMR